MKLNSSIYLCLIFVPLPILGKMLALPDVFIFITACLGIIPLAAVMGAATESIAEQVGTGLSSLVNATFGNACEFILAVVALKAGYIDVVKASITGSIIGNILLVLGGSMLAGGLKYKKQIFDKRAAAAAATLLALAAISLTVPTVFHYVYCPPPAAVALSSKAPLTQEIKLALAIAALQIITYFLGVFYSLQLQSKRSVRSSFTHSASPSLTTYGSSPHFFRLDFASFRRKWSSWKPVIKPLLYLLTASIFVAILSEHLVKALADAAQVLAMNKIFIGVILVAIIGNAAEHSTAIMMAWKNKMDLAMGIALGSGAQIALFVAPVIIFIGYCIGQPMDLRFTELELLSIIVSVIILAFVATDGECNWLEGVQLLTVYAILGAGFYFAG